MLSQTGLRENPNFSSAQFCVFLTVEGLYLQHINMVQKGTGSLMLGCLDSLHMEWKEIHSMWIVVGGVAAGPPTCTLEAVFDVWMLGK